MKLTLRDLFWLVLVAACLCAWWMDHRRLSANYQNLEQSIADAAAKKNQLNAQRRKRIWLNLAIY